MKSNRSRHVSRTFTVALFGLLALASLVPAFAASEAGTGAPQDDANRLVLQKKRLILTVLSSETVKSALSLGGSAARELRDEIEDLMNTGCMHAEKGALAESETSFNAAMKKVASLAAIGSRARSQADTGRERRRYRELLAGINGYLNAVRDAEAAKGRSEFSSTTQNEILRHSELAETAARQGAFGQANEHLTKAYKLAVQLVTALRDKETIVYELKFDVPWDEYEYEKERNNSFIVLIDTLLLEHNPPPSVRKLVRAYQQESRKYFVEAQKMVGENRIEPAIGVMENANRLLTQALRAISPKYAF